MPSLKINIISQRFLTTSSLCVIELKQEQELPRKTISFPTCGITHCTTSTIILRLPFSELCILSHFETVSRFNFAPRNSFNEFILYRNRNRNEIHHKMIRNIYIFLITNSGRIQNTNKRTKQRNDRTKI